MALQPVFFPEMLFTEFRTHSRDSKSEVDIRRPSLSSFRESRISTAIHEAIHVIFWPRICLFSVLVLQIYMRLNFKKNVLVSLAEGLSGQHK